MTEGDTIVRLTDRGQGLSESGRRVVLAAPGDSVAGDGTVFPGPHHAVPPCRHYPECGGCQLQHVDDKAYGDYLVDRIASALAGQGIAVPEILPPHISPPRSRRRAALSVEKKGRQVLLGFKAGSTHRIVDMRECWVLRQELFALVGPLRDLLGTLSFGRGQARVKLTLADQGVDCLIEGATAEGLRAIEALGDFAATHRLARLAIADGATPQTFWEPESVTITLGGTPVGLPHDAFLQATEDGEGALRSAVLDAVGDAATIADLFAGLGTFALAKTGRVYAAEGDRSVALALKHAANRTQRPIAVQQRDLFQNPLDTKELARFEAIILDPPRAGARDQIGLLARSEVQRIAYVSCNPITFARDARALIDGGYRLKWSRPIGQFRWSTHVELAAAFERRIM